MVILLFSIGLGRSIARPVNLAVEIAGEIAAGNLVQEVPDRILSRKDELGSLAVALQSMIEKLRQVLGEVYAAVGQVSSGRLRPGYPLLKKLHGPLTCCR